jgi:hypothetical protein
MIFQKPSVTITKVYTTRYETGESGEKTNASTCNNMVIDVADWDTQSFA